MPGIFCKELKLQEYDVGLGLCPIESCERDPICQEICKADKCCVFGDVEERLPEATRTKLAKVSFLDNKRVSSLDASEREAALISAEAAYEALLHICKDSQNFLDSATSACAQHRQMCAVYKNRRRGAVCIEAAGTVCKDWSRAGHKRGRAGPSARSFAVWLVELKHRDDIDAFLQECTEDFDENLIKDELGYQWQLDWIVLSPQAFGWGLMRPRKFVIGVRASKYLLASDLATFARVLCNGSQINGEAYFIADKKQVDDALAREVQERRHGVISTTGEFNADVNLFDTLPFSAQGCLLICRQHFKKQMVEKAIPEEEWQWPIVDLQAVVPMRMWEDSALRTVLTHGTHWSLNPQINRYLLGDELLVTQGMPMFASLGCPYTCKKIPVLQQLTEKQKCRVAGNAFNMEIISMLSLWVLGNMVERSVEITVPLEFLQSNEDDINTRMHIIMINFSWEGGKRHYPHRVFLHPKRLAM